MDTKEGRRQWPNTMLWVLGVVCLSALLMVVLFGGAHTRANAQRNEVIAQRLYDVERALVAAESQARAEGLVGANDRIVHLLKSDERGAEELTDYERYVLDAMIDFFGPERDFDFMVSRFIDETGEHTYLYYFPVRGKTDIYGDRYFISKDGKYEES